MQLLVAHLRRRLFSNEDNTEQILIEDDLLHEHPILNIKYTSYEVAQERDIVHIGYGRTGVMVYTPMSVEDESEPWLYANILGIYHITLRTASDSKPKSLTLLWVRWMQHHKDGLNGPNSQNYTRISFVLWSGILGNTFDFVDPSHIIRACHLIPAFALGRTCDLLDPSIARDPQGDWCAYYPNRYSADRPELKFTDKSNYDARPHHAGLSTGMPLQGLLGLESGVNASKQLRFSTSK